MRVSRRFGGHIMGWSLLPPFGPSGILQVVCSLSGPPVVRQLMRGVVIMPGQGGQFQLTVP